MSEQTIRLTQYSHGAGCGCKISPKVLETILHSEQAKFVDPNLLVGNETRDDAAVYDWVTAPALSVPPTSLCRLSTTRSISGVLRPPTPSAIFSPWGQTDYGDCHSGLAD